jgi:hypothetical protein
VTAPKEATMSERRTWPKVPKHIRRIYGSRRAFKAQKRRERRAVEKALSELRCGCAFIPESVSHLNAIAYHLDALYNNMRVSNWGR